MIRGDESSTTEPMDRLSRLSPAKRALYVAMRARQDRDARLAKGAVAMLREGTGTQDTPEQGMVLIHPVGGGLLCYGELIRALPGSYPVYGLAADAALTSDDPPGLVALAERYLRRLDDAQVRPQVFAGWSFGGMVAYEMGHTVAAAGAECAVAVIDAMPGLGPLDVPADAAEHGVLRSFATDLVRSSGGDPTRLRLPEAYWGLAAEDAMGVLRTRLEELGLRIEMSVQELLQRLQVYAGAAEILRSYRPRPAGPAPHLVWANDTAADVGTVWSRHVATPASSLNVPGDHYSLLRMPVVQRVADVLHQTMTPFLGESSTPGKDVSGGTSAG